MFVYYVGLGGSNSWGTAKIIEGMEGVYEKTLHLRGVSTKLMLMEPEGVYENWQPVTK